MSAIEFALKDEKSTQDFGARLGDVLVPGDAVCLTGNLGAGKSTLARGMIKSLAGADEAPSPTFTFVETYETERFLLWHFDFYRLERPDDVWELGYEEALEDGVLVIEWPERIGDLAPPDALEIRLEIEGKGRKAIVSASDSWRSRLSKAGIA